VLRLWLLRHAKSRRDVAGLTDLERPLAPRGRRATLLLAEYVDRHGIRPDVVLCSPARRTRETVEPLVEALGSPRVLLEEGVYAASAAELLDLVRALPPDTGSVLVVGHNPGLEDLLELLGTPGTRLPEKYPTGALATLAFEGPWEELRPGAASLEAYVVPREL
jgi:phosphohistidine phosphatase